jgi:hypothetical protein
MNVEKVWGARYKLGVRYLSKRYGTSYIHLVQVCMCMCHSQRFHFIVKQAGNNSPKKNIYIYIIYYVKINYSLVHVTNMSSTDLHIITIFYSVCVKIESVMFCGLKMQLIVLKHSHYLTVNNKAW